MRAYPVSWGEWVAGVQNAYDLEEILESRISAGAVLSPEEEHLRRTSRRITSRYDHNGRAKFRKTEQPARPGR